MSLAEKLTEALRLLDASPVSAESGRGTLANIATARRLLAESIAELRGES